MTIEKLFTELENLTNVKATNTLFEQSGMVNKYNQLDYGFFPLGHGILSSDTQHDKHFKIMILGNDFGTEIYLTDCIKNGKRESETKYPTIRNLRTKLDLNLNETFFTNFHLGVRSQGKNTERIVKLTSDYQDLCYRFFIKQMEIINPQIVICLGHEVRRPLIERSDLFSKWKPRNTSIKKIYSSTDSFQIDIHDSELGIRKFILLPHPCDNRNFRDEYIEKVKQVIKKLA